MDTSWLLTKEKFTLCNSIDNLENMLSEVSQSEKEMISLVWNLMNELREKGTGLENRMMVGGGGR